MIDDSILSRAERLIKGDIILWANAPWCIRLIEKTSLTELEIVLEPIHTHDDDRIDHPDIRTTVERDRKFRVLRLV